MPKPDDSSGDALKRLDQKLDAFQAQRTASATAGSTSAGYRLFGEVIGGVLGGLGVGWTVDHFAHTGPWGIILGLAIGAVGSVWAAVATAVRTSDAMTAEAGVPPDAPADADEED